MFPHPRPAQDQSLDDRHFFRIVRAVFAVPCFATLLGALALFWQIHHANQTVDGIELTETGIIQISVTEGLLVDQEAGLRGYQITRNALFLSPYHDAERQIVQSFDRTQASVQGNGEILSLLDQLKTAHDGWQQDFAVPMIATIRAGGRTDDLTLNLLGKTQMDNIRRLLVRISRLEEQQRAQEVERWRRQLRDISIVLLVFAVIFGLIVAFYTTALMRSILQAFRASNASLRQRADEAFRSEQRLRITLASIGEAVITCDPHGCVQTWNEVATRLTGLTEASATGKSLTSVVSILSPATREPRPDPFPALVQQPPDAVNRDAILVRPDGSEILIEEAAALLQDQHGVVTGYVLVFRDITMTRKSQQALMANEKLAVAGRLAASIAHEIHNPLDAISNLLFLMDGVSSPEENAQFLELARNEIARVTQISRAMLSLHRQSDTPVAVDFREMLSSILLLLDRRFATLGVSTTAELPEGVILNGFPAELRQVFTNLLINAAEASPCGGTVHLIVEPVVSYLRTGTQRLQPGVCVFIEDEGPGIPETTLNRLFEPFVTTKGESGTGLGLWISKGIITKHGGEIVLESSTADEDHGTTAVVFLPYAETPVVAAA